MRAGTALVGLLPLFIGCSPTAQDKTTSAGWSGVPNAYADHFEQQVRGGERRLVVFGPEGRNDTIGVYAYRSSASGKQDMPWPLDRVVALSTTHLPYFSALGSERVVVGAAHTDQLRDPKFLEALRTGALEEVGLPDGVDVERLIALAPQAVFDHPFGRKERATAANVPTIEVAEYLEAHPLGRAEWIRFFGMLLGREEQADSIFAAIEHRYTVLRDMKQHLPDGPGVFFGSRWQGDWFAPPGNSYMATLISDAGGRYVLADTVADGNITIPLERVLLLGDTVDHFGVLLADPGKVDRTVLTGGDRRLLALRSLRSGAFVGNSAKDDLFGQALLEPDEVLRDLRCIFHPGSCGVRVPRYFRPVLQ
ncbi:MAG: ABC transporter substrate-binding protein [Flavobacteriales bacterium]|nr:ABC transporter substrate-binding protein [Flavobacteriales bacterium]MCB9179142.1 ABC transporter substrate-binding protein [Flavobacteriales bacterium]